MTSIIVLGAGMVGSAMAKDLSADYNVTSADINPNNLNGLEKFGIKTLVADLSDKSKLKGLIEPYNYVLCAVPGFMGFKTIETIIEAKKNFVDISFFPEDCFELNEKAKQYGVTGIVDFGVAPGIPNLLVGYHTRKMEVHNYKCYVGGLPKIRTLPFQYKAPFSPVDVIEEYTRPARYIEDGKLIVKDAMSDSEYLEFDEIGTLEAFNTDGLRSLLFTNEIPNRIEKTLRYPGHIELMKTLVKSGLLSEEEIDYKGIKIKPRDFTSSILFNKWKLGESEDEFTVMRIIFEGLENGLSTKYVYNLHDKRNPETNISSMARTTGYSGTAAMNLLIKGIYSDCGINPPEFVGKNDAAVDFVFEYLKERGVIYKLEKHQTPS